MILKPLRSILLLTSVLVFVSGYSQDAFFGQLNANRTYFNPAFSGLSTCQNITLNYRNQFPSLGVYQTLRGSYDAQVSSLNGGLGLQYVYDSQNNEAIEITYLDAKYSYQLPVNKYLNFSFGMEASYRHLRIHTGRLSYPDQIDQFYGFVRQSPTTATNDQWIGSSMGLGLGIVAYSEFYYLGVSVQNLFMESQAFSVPLKYSVQAGYNILVHKSLSGARTIINPHFIHQEQEGRGYTTLMVNVSRSNWMFGVGGRYSSTNPDAVITAIGYSFPTFPLSISYSYDFTNNGFGGGANGAHEIGLVYRLGCSETRNLNTPFSFPMI